MSTEDEVLALKQATREAHEVLKDLRHEVREARRVQATLKEEAIKALADGVSDIVRAGLESYMGIISRSIDEATDRVNARFDRLTEAFMGEDKANRRKGNASLPEMVEGLVAARDQVQPDTPVVRCAAGNDVRHHATYRCGPGCDMPVSEEGGG